MTWLEAAACRGMDVGIFFPGRGEPVGPALAVCAGCAVRDDCLADALDAPADVGQHGVAGGMTARQRTDLLRRRAAARLVLSGAA